MKSTRPTRRPGETFEAWDRRWRNALIRQLLLLGAEAIVLLVVIVWYIQEVTA